MADHSPELLMVVGKDPSRISVGPSFDLTLGKKLHLTVVSAKGENGQRRVSVHYFFFGVAPDDQQSLWTDAGQSRSNPANTFPMRMLEETPAAIGNLHHCIRVPAQFAGEVQQRKITGPVSAISTSSALPVKVNSVPIWHSKRTVASGRERRWARDYHTVC
jgi:hypothetical protein